MCFVCHFFKGAYNMTRKINMIWRKENIHVLSCTIALWEEKNKNCFFSLLHGNNCTSFPFSLTLVSDVLIYRRSWLGAWPMGLWYLVCSLWYNFYFFLMLECNREDFVCIMTFLAYGVMSHLSAHIGFLSMKIKALTKPAGLCSSDANVTSIQCHFIAQTCSILTTKRTCFCECLYLIRCGSKHSLFHLLLRT